MNIQPIRQAGAVIPLLMSVTALAMVIVHALIFGIIPEADEGTAAHIFQLLIVAQIPIVIFYAIKWLPLAPKQTLKVLALQACALLAAIAAVLFLT